MEGPKEKRITQRWRSRLRSGKLFDRSNRLLGECMIADLSESGARLKLVSDRPLPLEIRLYDDAAATLLPAAIVRVNGGEIGIRFLSPEEDPIGLSAEEIRRLGRATGRYP